MLAINIADVARPYRYYFRTMTQRVAVAYVHRDQE